MYYLSLPVLKALPERTEPLEDLRVVLRPGVNCVSGNVFITSAHVICGCALTSEHA